MQAAILDCIPISLAMVAALRPAANFLQPTRPARKLCNCANFVLVSENCILACVIVFGCAKLLVKQDWFTGGTGELDHVRLANLFNDMLNLSMF